LFDHSPVWAYTNEISETQTKDVTMRKAINLIIGLVVLLVVIFAINRGVFVGSEIRQEEGYTTHYRYCKYLTITGVVEDVAEGWGESLEEARRVTNCNVLREKS